jgi:hypothetical protein
MRLSNFLIAVKITRHTAIKIRKMISSALARGTLDKANRLRSEIAGPRPERQSTESAMLGVPTGVAESALRLALDVMEF